MEMIKEYLEKLGNEEMKEETLDKLWEEKQQVIILAMSEFRKAFSDYIDSGDGYSQGMLESLKRFGDFTELPKKLQPDELLDRIVLDDFMDEGFALYIFKQYLQPDSNPEVDPIAIMQDLFMLFSFYTYLAPSMSKIPFYVHLRIDLVLSKLIRMVYTGIKIFEDQGKKEESLYGPKGRIRKLQEIKDNRYGEIVKVFYTLEEKEIKGMRISEIAEKIRKKLSTKYSEISKKSIIRALYSDTKVENNLKKIGII